MAIKCYQRSRNQAILRSEYQDDGELLDLQSLIILPPKPAGMDSGKQEAETKWTASSCDENTQRRWSLENSALALASLNKDEDLSSSKLPFVWKLYEMLEDVEKTGNEHIVSWVAEGKAFKVHKMKPFVDEIIPAYFKQSKYKSFQRQLYFYDFTRIASGPDAGAYSHPKFLKGIKTLCLSMTPKKSKRNSASSKCIEESSVASKGDASETKEQNEPREEQREDPSEWMTNIENLLVHGAVAATSEAPPRVIDFYAEEMAAEPTRPYRSRLSDGDTVFVFGGMPFHYLDIEFTDI